MIKVTNAFMIASLLLINALYLHRVVWNAKRKIASQIGLSCLKKAAIGTFANMTGNPVLSSCLSGAKYRLRSSGSSYGAYDPVAYTLFLGVYWAH